MVLRVLTLSLLLTLLGRLWYLQVLAEPTYSREALDNQTGTVLTPGPRGEIVDDRGLPMAMNKTALVISVDRSKLQRQQDGGKAVLRRLALLLHMTYQQLEDRIALCAPGVPAGCWNGLPFQPIPVSEMKADASSTRLALQILERKEDFPGVIAEVAAVRSYPKPDGAYASQVIGNLGPITQVDLKRLPATQRNARLRDLVGRQGLEQQYEEYLRGRAGITKVSLDHVGAVTGTIAQTAPTPGDNLVTSLDARVQSSLESALAGAVKHARQLGVSGYGGPADFAAGVVLDAQTGHVVAMGSYPSYDPSLWDGGRIDTKAYDKLRKQPGTPLVDKAYQSAYSPGSTFKLISTAGLLHDGQASINGTYDCSSAYNVGSTSFHNFESESYGPISLHETIVKSCDTVYYGLAYRDWVRDNNLVSAHKKPIEGVQHIARDFGLGTSVGLDLPSATSGHIADRNNTLLQWKATHKNYCIGAKRRKPGDPIKAYDQEYCTDGWRFSPGLQLIEDIGQGSVLVSPLQLAVAYAALANGGTVYKPRVGKAILSPSGKVVKMLNAKVRDHLPLSKTDLDYIRTAMYDVPKQGGTASGAFIGFPFHKVAVGGKTGSAELGLNRSYTSAWFASFAGLAGQKPRFVTVIMVDKGGIGGTVAAPAVRQVWDTVFGIEGKKAAFPTGRPPSALPKVGNAISPPSSVSQPPSTNGSPGSISALPDALPVRFERDGP